MTSKNPDNDIEANIVFEGGFNPCNAGSNSDVTPAGCDAGYVPDTENLNCYMVLPDLMTSDLGNDVCMAYSNGTLLYFDNDNQVRSFYSLLSTGKIM